MDGWWLVSNVFEGISLPEKVFDANLGKLTPSEVTRVGTSSQTGELVTPASSVETCVVPVHLKFLLSYRHFQS